MPNTAKRNPFKATVLAAALAVLPLATHAAGLGKITVLSALGQPLKAELEVTATRDEALSLVARVASIEAFRQAGIEYAPALVNLRFSKEIKERGGRRYVELSTDRPLNEPFIDMLVELSWASGRLVREYTFLLDPPDLNRPLPAAAAAVTAPSVRPEADKAVVRPAGEAQTRPVTEARAPVATERAVAPAAKPSEGGATRAVVSGDTLGKIAAQTMPSGVSLDQMLVSLFRNNQDAFDGGNMNRLKAGKILSIPDAETVGKIAPSDARKEVVAQAADFNLYRQRLAAAAAAAPARDEGARQEAKGKIAPKVEDKAPAASGKDKLEVSRTEVARDAKGKPLQGRITALEEDLVARERALKEAGSRIAELEKNLNDLKKLAELKSKGGADIQAAAQAAKPATVPAATPAPVAAKPAETPKPAEPAKTEVPKSAEAPKPADAAKPADGAKPADAPKPAEGDKPPPPKKKAAPPPPPPPEPDFIEENGPLVFGGGAILAMLFGWLGISAYRKKKAASADSGAPIAEADLSAHSVFSTTVAPPPSEQETSQFSTTGMGMVAAQDTVDPVVEADTFLAFGRDAQAEEILLDALNADPQPQALPIRMKLLEIYSARRDTAKFESVAKDVQGLTGGSGELWDKVVAMGAAIDPGNSLYGSAAPIEADATAVMNMQATTIMRPAADGDMAASPTPAAPAEEASTLDFDLDLGASAPAAAVAIPAAVAESTGLDFDLDLGSSAPAESAAPVAEAAKVEDLGLDIDFEMPAKPAESGGLDFPLAADQPAAAAPEPVAVAPAGDGNSIDFSFDLGTPATAAEPAPAAPEALPAMSLDIPVAEPAAPALDLGGLSLELDAPAPAAPAATPISDVPDNPEVATKLELAAAYEEMGDRDGARELYQEAVSEGSPAQQEAARAKLAALG